MTLQLTKKHSFDPVLDSQKIYRRILEAISNPGQTVSIQDCADKLYGDHPAFLAVAMALLDNEVSFHVSGNSSLADEITSLVHAKQERVEAADFIFVCDLRNMKFVINNAKYGTHCDPHKSAIVIIQNDSESSVHQTLSGPGINGRVELFSTQAIKDALLIRERLNHEYPLGIDFLFISSAGALQAVPRLVKVVK